MSRWKAASIHLALSALIIGTVVALVLWRWYPPALLRMSGAGTLIGLIAIVDVVAGPLLTLILFRAGKPGLRFDLTMIALAQAALLGYGLFTLASIRPVYLVGAVDRLELVAANELDEADLAQAAERYRRLSWTGPQRVGAKSPQDADLRMIILDRALAGTDIHLMPSLYVPFEEVQEGLRQRAFALTELLASADARERARIESALDGRSVESVACLPINSRRGVATMLIDAASGEPLRAVDVDIWDVLSRRTVPQAKAKAEAEAGD